MTKNLATIRSLGLVVSSCSAKSKFLKILLNLQENTCATFVFLIKVLVENLIQIDKKTPVQESVL